MGQLRFEIQPLGRAQLELQCGDDFAGAFAGADVAHAEFARVAPIAVEGRVLFVGRHLHQVLDHPARLRFAEPVDKCRKRFPGLPLVDVPAGDALDHRRDVFGRHAADGQPVAAGVVRPLTAEQDLKMRHLVVADGAAVAVEADVGQMMLAAGVETTAHLDFQSFHCFIEREELTGQPRAQFPRQTARRSDAEFAGVRARAGGHVENRTGSVFAQPDPLQFRVQGRQVLFADPADEKVLLDAGAHVVAAEPADEIGQLPGLRGGDVAERTGDSDGGVTALPLTVHVRGQPCREAGRLFGRQRAGRLDRFFLDRRELRPARVGGQCLAFGEHEAFESLDAQLVHEELDAGTGAILFLAKPGKDAGDRLRGGQQFLHRQKLRQHFCLIRHRAETAADKHFEPASAVMDFGDGAEVVHVHQPAGFVLAAGESRLEFPSEILRVRVAEQKERQRLRVRRHIKRLGAADTRQRAGGDVADRVAAGLAGGDADGGQAAHDGRGVFDVDEMQLEILPGRDVQNAVGILLGDIGECFELRRVQAAERDLDPLHTGRVPFGVRPLGQTGLRIAQLLRAEAIKPLPVVITLAVRAAPQPRLGEKLLVNFAEFAQLQLRLININFLRPRRRDLTGEFFLPSHSAATLWPKSLPAQQENTGHPRPMLSRPPQIHPPLAGSATARLGCPHDGPGRTPVRPRPVLRAEMQVLRVLLRGR